MFWVLWIEAHILVVISLFAALGTLISVYRYVWKYLFIMLQQILEVSSLGAYEKMPSW